MHFPENMISNRLRNHILEHMDVSETELETILNAFELKEFSAKTLILKKGRICQYAGFVSEGCLIAFYKFHNKEQVFSFPRENWWIGDVQSLIYQMPSNYYIKTLEDTKIYMINKNNLKFLIEKTPKFLEYYMTMIFKNYANITEQYALSLSLSVEERYLEMLSNTPELINRIPDKFLASILGIQPPSLSRIKRRKFKKDD